MRGSLFEKLKEYGESDHYPFHMPGHKRNPDSGPLSAFYKWDITEIDGFDNLHQPEGIIKDAQERAARLYQSEETYFLVNGSTAGILSAVSAVSGRGRKLIAARNCHKAVYHAAFLNRLEMEYIYPEILTNFGISGGISAGQTEDKIREIAEKEGVPLRQINTLIAGIILTSPTYDGILSDVEGIVKTAHSYGIPVIIDQAHGAHFGFHPAFPQNAVMQGADMVIHSVHKTLPAPTQTALIHRNGSLTEGELLRKYLRIYQSSSPSYLLMAGIDASMELLEKEGKERLERMISYRKAFMKEMKSLKYVRIYPSMAETGRSKADLWKSGTEEPGRLLLSVRGLDLTGQQFYDLLREEYHLQMEMCGADYVLAILSMLDTEEGFIRLGRALLAIDERVKETEENSFFRQNYRPEAVLRLDKAFTAPSVAVTLKQAEGRISADFVNLYPPGIPIVVPGEKLDREVIEVLEKYLANGYTVQGILEGCHEEEKMLRVISSM